VDTYGAKGELLEQSRAAAVEEPRVLEQEGPRPAERVVAPAPVPEQVAAKNTGARYFVWVQELVAEGWQLLVPEPRLVLAAAVVALVLQAVSAL
jgi:hypothetical protein